MRPAILHVGGTLYWTIQTYDPDKPGVLKDADSTPSVAVRKNGASSADSVTITKRSATTGLYDCSYNPAAEVEGDTFQLEETATVTGTTTSSATYTNQFSVRAVHAGAVELDSSSRVKLAADQPDYVPATAASVAAVDAKIGTPETSLSAMVGNVPTVAEFEARTIAAASYRQNITLRGTDITEAKAFDLLLAASAGITSQPSGTTEKFKFLDGNDAFTTTFDTNGNRTGVSLA